MRLHALHVRGLSAPPGAQGIPLRGAYSLVTGRARSLDALLEVLLALLRPERALRTLTALEDPRADENARAVLTFRAGAQVYRAAADPERERLILARHDEAEDRFVRVATGSQEVDRALVELGRPRGDLFERLCVVSRGPDAPPASAVVAEGRAAPRPPTIGERAADRAAPRGEVDEFEAEERRLMKELERFAPLLAAGDELESRLQRYRALRADCERGLVAVERTRREALEQQSRLEKVPATQTRWLWLGALLTIAGGAGGYLVDPLVGSVAAVGIATLVTALLITRSSRRRVGRLEARLAALRVREGSLQQRLEEEAPHVRELVLALGLEEVDELEGAAASARQLSLRLEEVHRLLEDARGSGSPPSFEPLAEVEPDPADTAPTLVASIPPPPDEEDRFEAERLIDGVAGWTDRASSDVCDEIRSCLPLYLNAVARSLGGELPVDEAGIGSLLSPGGTLALDSEDRFRVTLAIRLALLERLAPDHRLPLLVGPLPAASESGRSNLGRAFARVASVTQVVQFAEVDEPWRELTTNLHAID
jgi:hypothetical protein